MATEFQGPPNPFEEDLYFANNPVYNPPPPVTTTVSGKPGYGISNFFNDFTKVTNSVVPLIGALRDKGEVQQKGYIQPGTQRYNQTGIGQAGQSRMNPNWLPIVIGGAVLMGAFLLVGMFFNRKAKA